MIHRRVAGGQFRAAAQAGAKTGLLRFLRSMVKSAVDFLGRLDRANRAAVDAGRFHADEKQPVKPMVPRPQRLIKCLRFLQHRTQYTWMSSKYSPFSDIEILSIRWPKMAGDGVGPAKQRIRRQVRLRQTSARQAGCLSIECARI